MRPPCSPSSVPSSDLNVGMARSGWGNTRQSQHGAAYINPPVQAIASNQNFCCYNWPCRLNKNYIKLKQKTLLTIHGVSGSLTKLAINANRGQAVRWFRWGRLKSGDDQSVPSEPVKEKLRGALLRVEAAACGGGVWLHSTERAPWHRVNSHVTTSAEKIQVTRITNSNRSAVVSSNEISSETFEVSSASFYTHVKWIWSPNSNR